MIASLVPVFLLLLFGFAILRSGLRIVPQQQAWIVERLGRFHRALGPGLNVLIPFTDRVAYRFDLREVPTEVAPQVCISLDNTTLTVDGFLYLQITDPVKAAYGSSNPMAAAMEEDAINWGIKVLRYEIKDITPPMEILRAMELQITAEREKRATIAKSEGQRQMQINTSEGQRQQEINIADGRKQAEVLRAEGEARAISLVATATADAIRSIAAGAVVEGGIEALQMQLAKSYIDQWGNLAKASTTMIIPTDLGNIGAMVGTTLQIVRGSSIGGPGAPPRPIGSVPATG